MTFEELSKLNMDFAPFMLSLSEGEDNRLSVKIALSYAGKPCELTDLDEPHPVLRGIMNISRPILPDKKHTYEIVFEDYIIYQIGNESYCSGDPADKFTGKYFRIYESSALLRRLGDFSDAQALEDGSFYPGKWRHFGIVTQNHIIDVISASESVVKIFRKT